MQLNNSAKIMDLKKIYCNYTEIYKNMILSNYV